MRNKMIGSFVLAVLLLAGSQSFAWAMVSSGVALGPADSESFLSDFYVDYSSGIVHWSDSPDWKFSNTSGEDLLVFDADVNAVRHQGAVGMLLPEEWILFPQSSRPRLEFTGSHQYGQVKSRFDTPSSQDYTFIFFESSTDTLVSTVPSRNSFMHEMSAKTYDLVYGADYDVAQNFVLTTYIGGTYRTTRKHYHLIQDNTAGIGELTQFTGTCYWGPKFGLNAELKPAEGLSVVGDLAVSVVRAHSTFRSWQAIPALATNFQSGDSDTDTGSIVESKLGVRKAVGPFVLGADAGVDYWSYTPEIFNPKFASDPKSHLEQESIWAWHWTASVTYPF